MQRSNRGKGAPHRPEARTPRAPDVRRLRNRSAALGGLGLRAGAAAVLGAAVLAGPAAAQDPILPHDPPRAGQSIIAFPERNMVEAGGYGDGQEVRVDVVRNGMTIGTATGIAEGDVPGTPELEGAVEVNHPGGACWTGAKPDIQAGDRIVATSGVSADASTVAYVRADDYARYVKDGATPIRDAEGLFVVRTTGSAVKPDGTTYAPELLEARLVNPERFSNESRTMRADTSGANDGTLDYDVVTGRWTAEWHLTQEDAAKAVDAEPRIMWLGTDPAAESELTIFEFGVGDEGCGSGGVAPIPDAIGNFVPPAPIGVNEAPQDGRVIEVFPSRDFVALAGFSAGESAMVEVFRHMRDAETGEVTRTLVGRARGLKPDAGGEIEVNHPGGACWETSATMPFPDLRPHDQVRVTAYDLAGRATDVSQTTIADVMIRENTVVSNGGNIVVEGEARTPEGTPWPVDRADELEVRLRSKAFRPINNDKQDLRAVVGDPTDSLTVNDDGTFVAVFRGKSEAIQEVALAAATEQRIMWLGADPAAGSEATLFERGAEIAGVPECDPAPGPDAPQRDQPFVTPLPAGAPAGPQPSDPVLVPGLGGVLSTVTAPDGTPVLRGQVDERSLARIAETGVVQVLLEQKARPNGVLYRFKIRKANGGGGAGRAAAVTAAAPKGKVVATFWRAAPKKAGRYRFRLKSRALRSVSRGRYVVEVTPTSAARRPTGKTMRIAFRVR
jgi:hypothetical protein